MYDSSRNAVQENAVHKHILRKLLSFKSVGVLIVTGIIVVSISNFVDSVSSLIAAFPKPEFTISAFDTKTQEETLSVAKKIDNFFSYLIEASDTRYVDSAETYRTIDVDLQNLLLRQESRPLNELSVHQQLLLIEQFNELRNLHRSQDKVSKEFVKGIRSSFHDLFKTILNLEASKPKT